MQNNVVKKTLVFVVIALFFCMSTSSAIYATEENPKTDAFDDQLIKYKVIEFKSDGTNETTILQMTIEDAKKFKLDLKNAISDENRLHVFKNYGFIPDDVTFEKLKLGMEEKSERIGLTSEKLENFFTRYKLVNRNLFCSVSGGTSAGFRALFGTSLITRFLNWYLYKSLGLDLEEDIPSFDLFNLMVFLFGGIFAGKGLLPDFVFLGMFAYVLMIGFVGYYATTFENPLAFLPIFVYQDIFLGYSAYVAVGGLNFFY